MRPQPLEATGPNQVWSWDITYLAGTVRGMFFYLYLIMDVYSRKIVGWEVYPEESAAHAASVFHKGRFRNNVNRATVVVVVVVVVVVGSIVSYRCCDYDHEHDNDNDNEVD